MNRTIFAVVTLLCVSSSTTFPDVCQAVPDPDLKTIKLDHKTLDLVAEGRTMRFELRGSIANGAGRGKIRFTADGVVIRNIYGDRVNETPEKGTTTEHDVTLELVTPKSHLPGVGHEFIPDPSPTKDRVLYRVQGIELGTNRGLLLVVTSSGPQRLIYLGRCGGTWAATLEKQDSFDGPAKK